MNTKKCISIPVIDNFDNLEVSQAKQNKLNKNLIKYLFNYLIIQFLIINYSII